VSIYQVFREAKGIPLSKKEREALAKHHDHGALKSKEKEKDDGSHA
jgi:hypothetical protein